MGLGTLAIVGLGMALAQGETGLTLAGKQIRLEEPKAVAVGVKDVSWERRGRALMYDAVDADGYYQGLFRTQDGKVKAVLRFKEGTNFHDWKWLPNRLSVVEILSRDDAATKTKRWSVYLLDAQNLTARELLGINYPSDEQVSMSMDMSPSRDHALITVRDAKGERVYVLLDNGSSMVLSSDITQAKQKGASFAGWSSDGTAYFSGDGLQDVNVASDKIVQTAEGGVFSLRFATTVSKSGGVALLSDIPILGKILWRAAPIAPTAGTPVLEVMPWNGGLRPVRSRGPFEIGEYEAPDFEPKAEAAQVTASLLKGSSGSLWLVPELEDEKKPRRPGGLLVAAEAGQSWMPLVKNWIAYETAGALFVRAITLKN